MKSKLSYIVIAIIIILAGGYYLFGYRQAKAPVVDSSNQSGQIKPPEQKQDTTMPVQDNAPQLPTTPAPAGSRFSDENDVQPPPPGEPKRVEVDYDGTQFDPPSVTIAVGDTVVFRNKSQSAFWPASNPHPTHSDYPGFDARKNIAPGETYEFTFSKVGRWSYHNHLSPSVGGTITVTK